jgi:TolA-binding protein
VISIYCIQTGAGPRVHPAPERDEGIDMKRISAIILFIALLCLNAYAEDKKDAGFWDGLKGKIEKLAPKKKITETTAVGGVRGTRDSSSEGLYWKGEDRKEITDDEVRTFRAALENASAGKRDEAATQFGTFVQLYPNSLLKADALRSIEELKTEK